MMQNFMLGRRGYNFEQKVSDIPAKSEYDRPKQKIARLSISYLAGSQRKGVNASLTFIELEKGENCIFETFSIFGEGNTSMWAKVLARKSDKEVIKVAEQLDSKAPLIVAAFVEDPAKGKAALQQAISELEAA
jgi:hypothetical protein